MTFQKKFEEILINNSFDQLSFYTKPELLRKMTDKERELLGILLVKQGEHQLKSGDSKVIDSFQLASKIAPRSPNVYFRQGLVYASQDMNIRCLLAASEALEKATDLDSKFLNAWHAWGNVLARIGVFYQESKYFQLADQKFGQVEKICLNDNFPNISNFYWHWGVCWYYQGKHSGEAIDFINALAKLRQADETGFENGDFYNDYGNVLVELASLIGRQELLSEAINKYKKAVKLLPNKYESWLNLACTYHRLYDFHNNDESFRLADESFSKAAGLSPKQANIWIRWGELYAYSGKSHKNLEHLKTSLEKFEKANAIDSDHPYLLLRWGEAQMLWATQMENLVQLREAQTKITKSLDLCPEDSQAWYIYGTCLRELGNYFDDEEYYRLSIEKLQYGLSLNKSHPTLWYGLALSYSAIGELQSDVLMLEKAARFFSRVIEFGGQITTDFWNDWGETLLKLAEITQEKKCVEEAIEKFEQAIAYKGDILNCNSKDFECLYNYGCALDFLGDLTEESAYYEKAIQILSYLIQQDPDHTCARYNLALALSHLGELNTDVDCFHQAISLLQDLLQEDIEDEMAWNDCGQILLNLAFLTQDHYHTEYGQKLYEQAEIKLLHAVGLGCVQAFYNLTCLYSLLGNYTAAMHYLERAQISNALPSLEDVMNDEWLEGLRNTHIFRSFISQLASQQEKEK